MADVENLTAQLHQAQETGQGDASTTQISSADHQNVETVQTITFTMLANSENPAIAITSQEAIIDATPNQLSVLNTPSAIAVTSQEAIIDTTPSQLSVLNTPSAIAVTPSAIAITSQEAITGTTPSQLSVLNTPPVSLEQPSTTLTVTTASLELSTAVLDTSTASVVSEESSPSKVKKTPKTPGKWAKYKKRYNVKWESEPGMMEWVRRVPGDETKALCRFCRSMHRAHRNELMRHSNSQKHKSQSAFVLLPENSSQLFMTQEDNQTPRIFKSMRVVRVTEWGNTDVLDVFNDVSMPEPENDQVLIKVGAAGVNPVDAYIRSGQYANLPSLPWTPGLDCSGTVEHVGHAVTKFKSGDRVYTNGSLTGTYAEYTLCSEENVFMLPDQLDFKGGAALGIPYFTAYRALIQRARARAGHTVLIHGASGSVGMAAVQFARAYGMTVMGTAGTEEGMMLVRDFGAHFVFNHRHEDYTDQILTATEGDGVDVVIEMLANVNLQKDLELLSMGGIIAVVGNRGVVEINPRLLMPKECAIIGVMLQRSTKKERAEAGTAVKAGIEAGWIRPHIGMEFSLDNAGTAHDVLMTGNGAQGRMVLVL